MRRRFSFAARELEVALVETSGNQLNGSGLTQARLTYAQLHAVELRDVGQIRSLGM
ncbi:hypothetical protein [Pseudomonas viridiflava]|uniref:hypothetical protein n=1 Tax=Pseudomonas viridiflava TaxID=33069 RepID=UPI0013C2BCDC|nr:hypothetical protein [Pseudomonas viridiflava]